MSNLNSKYDGISWSKEKKKWKACIKIKSNIEFLGYYSNEEFAANEYNRAMFELGLADTLIVHTDTRLRRKLKKCSEPIK